MKFESALMTKASGSVGGLTATRGRGGSVFRKRVVPINRSSVAQQVVRNALAILANAWSTVLTQDQRNAWTLYGENVPLIDNLGASRQQAGISHYIRSNSPRLQAGLARVDEAPALFSTGNPPDIGALIISTDAGPPIVTSLNGDALLNAPDAAGNILFYMGRPTNPGVSVSKGPFNYMDKLDFAGGDPTAAVDLSAFPFPLVSGQKVSFRAQISYDDGRLSGDGTVAIIAP
jgi:hypothetical protein